MRGPRSPPLTALSSLSLVCQEQAGYTKQSIPPLHCSDRSKKNVWPSKCRRKRDPPSLHPIPHSSPHSAAAALDQAFSQLHIVPPIQSNPIQSHAIPDSRSAMPRSPSQSVQSGAAGEKWVIIRDGAAAAAIMGWGWDGSAAPAPPSLLSAICYSAPHMRGRGARRSSLGRRTDRRSRPSMPILPMHAMPKTSTSTSRARAFMTRRGRGEMKKLETA